jgi:hypothetical protein
VGDQHDVGYHSVGANEEIGQHPGFAATCGAIPLKSLTSEKKLGRGITAMTSSAPRIIAQSCSILVYPIDNSA